MIIKRFKNGNFNVKIEKEDNENNYLERDGFELFMDLINSIELDFNIGGDEGCESNYSMYYPLYNAYTDMMYYPNSQDLIDYKNGKTVKLIGNKINEEDRLELQNEGIL